MTNFAGVFSILMLVEEIQCFSGFVRWKDNDDLAFIGNIEGSNPKSSQTILIGGFIGIISSLK